jgi:hypothetical protein
MFKLCYLYVFRHTGVQYGFHIRERSSINSNTSGKNYIPVRIRSPPFVSGIRVAQSLIFFVVFFFSVMVCFFTFFLLASILSVL